MIANFWRDSRVVDAGRSRFESEQDLSESLASSLVVLVAQLREEREV